MDKNRKASAARKPSHCQRDQKGDRKQTPEQYLAIKKQEAVGRVMAIFNNWLEKRLAIISYACEASEASGGSAGHAGTGASGEDQSGSSSSRRPKRQFDGDDRSNSSAGGDENGQDRGGSKRAKKEVQSERMWACPFYKHDPKAHGKSRSCTGPGWHSLHRLKEHLYRKHRLPKHTCPRCTEPFEDAKDLSIHLRADVPCKKMDLMPLQGIDEAAEAKLRIRKKQGHGETDEQRWKDIYLILFPNANPNSVPSPYYDGNAVSPFPKAEDFKKFKKRIQKELPKLVQRRVERRFEKVQVEMLSDLGDIVRDGVFEFLGGLPSDDRSPSVTPAATPRATTPGFPAPDEPSSASHDEAKNAAMDLSYFIEDHNLPFMHFGGFDNFDFNVPFSFDDAADGYFGDKVSDSGYASNGTARELPFENNV